MKVEILKVVVFVLDNTAMIGQFVTVRDQWRNVRNANESERLERGVTPALTLNQESEEIHLLRGKLALQTAYINSINTTLSDYQRNQNEITLLLQKKRFENLKLKERLKAMEDYQELKMKASTGFERGLLEGAMKVIEGLIKFSMTIFICRLFVSLMKSGL